MGKVISLTKKEWERYKDDWRQTKDPGTKVVVYDRPIVYNRKRSAISVFNKFVLTKDRRWIPS